jgi:hypothetical protein
MRYIHSEETLPIPENGKLRFLFFVWFGCVCEGEDEGSIGKCQDAGGKDDIRDDQEYNVMIGFAN